MLNLLILQRPRLFGINSPINNFTLVVFANNVALVRLKGMSAFIIDPKYQNYIVSLLIKINGQDQLKKTKYKIKVNRKLIN
jgi:hypothetical protein